MTDFIYVDNSNLFIEGKRVAAVRNGLARDILQAMNQDIQDNSYSIDFGKLYQFLTGTDCPTIGRCYLLGSRPPPNDTLWDIAERAGFEVKVVDRNIRNKEKKIDTGIATEMVADALEYANKKLDTITLVAGDSDYVPPIERLINAGFKNVEVAFWNQCAIELKQICTKFTILDSHFDHLAYHRR
ncbi:NYN domain-containing protein [Alphaproteobacteria bacterium LSUCC0684]